MLPLIVGCPLRFYGNRRVCVHEALTITTLTGRGQLARLAVCCIRLQNKYALYKVTTGLRRRPYVARV